MSEAQRMSAKNDKTLRWTHWIPANIYLRLVADARGHHAAGVAALAEGDSAAARKHFAASVAAREAAATFAARHARREVTRSS